MIIPQNILFLISLWQRPSCALDFHDLRVCDQCEAAEFQLGKTPADQLAEDKLRFQQDAEMQKVADAADISVLFFSSAGANFWAILGHFWAILAI